MSSMAFLSVPVYDAGTGEFITRRVTVIGCLAHAGDTSQDPQFRLYLAQLNVNGSLTPIGVDSIPNMYLQGFMDQISRLHDVLIQEGDRDWAGVRVNFSEAKIVTVEGLGT